MTLEDLNYLTIADLAPRLQSRELSPVDVTKAALKRIDALNPLVNAFISIQAETAMESARRAEGEIQNGRYLGPLHGIPLALKDIFYTRGVPTTGGSWAMADFIPQHDATVVVRLRQAGAVLLGKLHMEELAYGSAGTNHNYGPGRNPWNQDHLSGGSSSGSGIAVAAGLAYGALGTDTGGSVRIPAALCGITGLKPTFGRVSLHGVMALAWTMDHGGMMARSAEDCALMLQATAGHDPADSSSLDAPVPNYGKGLRPDLSGVRLGLPQNALFKQADPEILAAVRQAVAVLERLGARVEEVSIPLMDTAFAASTVILMTEASARYLPLLRAHAHELGPEVRRRLESGLVLPGALYLQAQRVRRALRLQIQQVLGDVDALLTPTVPVVAPPIIEDDGRRTLTKFTRPFNLSGQPTLALPCGFSSTRLPISLQIVGRPLEEGLVLRVGYAFQSATDWHRRRPPIESRS